MSSTAHGAGPVPRRIFIPDQSDKDMIPAEVGQFNPEDLEGFSMHST